MNSDGWTDEEESSTQKYTVYIKEVSVVKKKTLIPAQNNSKNEIQI